ncbi:protein of unknown function (plasmid) [Paraburkholderia dioscoreae]|uniref:Uncharacterized protein n=1 Tax=Paraburkholderia dioscoreae TaxID=2604047 RepID=A0A5Q4YUY3_9BURK|nr:protein of unknown function [Paraburkholderia dioscoreae]
MFGPDIDRAMMFEAPAGRRAGVLFLYFVILKKLTSPLDPLRSSRDAATREPGDRLSRQLHMVAPEQ